MIIGIDATNIGGGGGITHLKEILESYDYIFFENKIDKIIIFGSSKTLEQLPKLEILDKLTFKGLNGSILKRLVFQIFSYDKHIKENNIDILMSLTGDYIGKFKPVVGMSRNMLLYEREIWKEIKSPKEIIRFWLNFKKQQRCFKNAHGVIFISDYAKSFIKNKINLQSKKTIKINHGLSTKFKGSLKAQKSISEYTFDKPYKLLYVSTVHVYKHQWNVIKALKILRKEGFPVHLNLIGGIISKQAGEKLLQTIEDVDPKKEFINYLGHIPYSKIENYYKETDGIVYASTCENMPNILLEAMASGNPISCSDKQPMPEFLKENGAYFNSHDANSIKNSIKNMLLNHEERAVTAANNLKEIKKYSWGKTSKQTFEFLLEIIK